MDIADRILMAAAIFFTFLWAMMGYSINKDRLQKLESRVNALEAEDK